MNSDHLLDVIGDAKDQHILSAIKTRETAPQRRSFKKGLLVAIAATLVLVTMTGAAVYTRWSKSMNAQYQASQEQREQAQDVGLSSMLEKEKQSDDILSVTDQGITVTAVQTIADDYSLQIVFRVEGFTPPEGMQPWAYHGLVTLDGKPIGDVVQCNMSCGSGFYEGIVADDNGKAVYEDGSPLKYDEEGNLIFNWVAPDGSMEYNFFYSFSEPGRHLGKVIEVRFTGFGHGTGKMTDQMDVEGDWRLHWTITGTQDTYKAALNTPIGDSGDILKEIEITPLSIVAVIEPKEYFDGWKTLIRYPRYIAGLRMKDGSTNTMFVPSSEGYQDKTYTLYEMQASAYRLYKLEDVEAVLFHNYVRDENGNYQHEYYEVPIR